MASKKDNKRLTAKTLIDKGKKQGSLTLSEIMEAFSETELDKDQVENLYETLGNLGIEIIEDKTQKADVDFSDNDNDLIVDKNFDGVSDDELKKEFAADVVINNVSTSLSSCEFISAIWNSYSKSVTALNPFSITFASYSFAKSTKRPLKLTTSTLGKCCVTLFISSTLSLIENNPTLSILTSTPTINLSKTLAPLVIISK